MIPIRTGVIAADIEIALRRARRQGWWLGLSIGGVIGGFVGSILEAHFR